MSRSIRAVPTTRDALHSRWSGSKCYFISLLLPFYSWDALNLASVMEAGDWNWDWIPMNNQWCRVWLSNGAKTRGVFPESIQWEQPIPQPRGFHRPRRSHEAHSHRWDRLLHHQITHQVIRNSAHGVPRWDEQHMSASETLAVAVAPSDTHIHYRLVQVHTPIHTNANVIVKICGSLTLACFTFCYNLWI